MLLSNYLIQSRGQLILHSIEGENMVKPNLVTFVAFCLIMAISCVPLSAQNYSTTTDGYAQKPSGTSAATSNRLSPSSPTDNVVTKTETTVIIDKDKLMLQERVKTLEKALQKRIREDLVLKEKKEKRLGLFGITRKKPFQEATEEPVDTIGTDESKIKKLTEEALITEEALEPFGQSFFTKGEEVPASLENANAPFDYTLGPGDTLKIIIWSEMGDETVYDVTVNPEGQVYIPIIGVLGVTGLTVAQFEETILGSLSGKFKHFKGQVTLTKIRTIQIFVAGEVQKPGAMIISGLSTAFNALYRAGGPSKQGTMRHIKIMRENREIGKIDLYKYFLAGDKSQDKAIESGDTIFVPPVGARVTIKGQVIRPAVYELSGEKSIADVLAMAGGVEPSAYTRRVKVFRWQGDQRRKILDIGVFDGAGALASFEVASGDEIEVEKALEEVGNRVKIVGAIRRAGEYAFKEGLTLSSLIERAGGIVLEEAAKREGQIIRKLDQGKEQIISFNLEEVLKKNSSNDIPLKPFDQIKIFTLAEIEADVRIVTIAGAVRRPGEYILRDGMKVRDLILRAQGLSIDFSGDVEIARAAKGHSSDIKRINITEIMKNPNNPENLPLQPLDKISVLSKGDDLVEAEIVVLKGEVKRPGPYALKRRGEKLSEVIARAGGLTNEAFPEGTIFMRPAKNIAHESQLKTADTMREELYSQATQDLRADLLRAGAKISDISPEKDETKPLSVAGEILGETKTGEETTAGRSEAVTRETSKYAGIEVYSRSLLQEMVRIPINYNLVLKEKPKENEDIVLQNGDQITIPAIPTTVSVAGAVVNPSTLLFQENRNVRYYIDRVGGFNDFSNHAKTVVIRANGEVFPLRRVGRIQRGDIIVVPPKAKLVRRNKLQESSQIAQILGNLAVIYKVAIEAN